MLFKDFSELDKQKGENVSLVARFSACFAAEDTVSIWGAFKKRPRNGAGSHMIPVNTDFHISSITNPDFKLGTQPFKFCFPLQVHEVSAVL